MYGADAAQDEADWNAHLDSITALETTVAAQQVLLDQLVTLLPPPPAGNDYIFLNGITSHISFPFGFLISWTGPSHGA